MTDRIQEVLDFWFGEAGTPQHGQFREAWFRVAPEFDETIRQRFGDLHESAAAGRLDAWREGAKGALALILLLDQFPRNMFRGTPRAFATDPQALAAADQAVSRRFDQDFPPVPRMFFYLPFEHSEDIADQERAVALMGELGLPDALDYAVRHRDIIARFGRFPHRNAVLGRPSTAEEIEFLKQPNSSF